MWKSFVSSDDAEEFLIDPQNSITFVLEGKNGPEIALFGGGKGEHKQSSELFMSDIVEAWVTSYIFCFLNCPPLT